MKSSPEFLFILLFFVMVFGPVGLLIVWYVRRQNRGRSDVLERIARQLGGASIGEVRLPGAPAPSPGFEREVDGVRYKVAAVPGRQELVTVFIETPRALPRAVLRRETWRDRLGKLLFLNREVQVGDETFDRAVYIESDDPVEVVRQMLRDATVRDAVARSVTQGNFVTVSREGVSTSVSIYDTDALRQIEAQVVALRDLSRVLVDVPGAPGSPRGARGDRFVTALWGAFAGLYALRFFSLMFLPGGFEPLHSRGQSLPKAIGGFVLLAFLPALFLVVRGHSRSLRNFFLGLFPGAMISTLAPPLLAWGANAALDHQPMLHVGGSVLEKTTSKASRSRTHWLKIALDQGGPSPLPYETIKIIVPKGSWSGLDVGQRVDVAVHPGAFGWPWVGPVTPGVPVGTNPSPASSSDR